MDYLTNPAFFTSIHGIRLIGQLFWVVTLVAALVLNRFDHQVHQRIVIFVLFTFLMEHVSSHPLMKNYFDPDTNSPWYHLGTPVLFFLLTTFYWDLMLTGKRFFLRYVLPIGFTLLVAVFAIQNEAFYRFPSRSVGIYCGSGIAFSIGYFLHQLRKNELESPQKDPLFWVSTGFLLYYAGSLLVWLTVNFLNKDHALLNSVYWVIGATTILLNSFFIAALVVLPERATKDQLDV